MWNSHLRCSAVQMTLLSGLYMLDVLDDWFLNILHVMHIIQRIAMHNRRIDHMLCGIHGLHGVHTLLDDAWCRASCLAY